VVGAHQHASKLRSPRRFISPKKRNREKAQQREHLAHRPVDAVPGHVTVSGHSGADPTTRTIAEQRTKVRKQTDVLLFDAINSACAEKDPVTKKCKEACTSNEYGAVRDWVIDRIHSDAKSLPATAADQKSWLQTNGTRFRGFTSESLSTKSTCSYGFLYNKLKNDIDAAIGKLSVPADVKTQFGLNFVVKEVTGPHERVLAHRSLEAALAN
jgi:hypothetical protein